MPDHNRGGALSRVADVCIIVAAIAAVGFTVSDRLAGRGRLRNSTPAMRAPRNWQAEVATGIGIGSSRGTFTIIEFMDLQCPFCAQWAARMDSLLDAYPDQVRLVLHHYPLSGHPHALAAAVALECANRQGKAREFQRIVFARRQEIGKTSWTSFARDATVPELGQFEHCASLPSDSFPRIAYGLELGQRSGVRGTPTVWVNGLVQRPTMDQLKKGIEKRD